MFEKNSITLRCPRAVGGRVTWSRESAGRTVNIISSGGDKDIKHIDDPFKRYSLLVDKSLYILRVQVSDSGKYLCNEAAVDLTVLPADRESSVQTWSRDVGEIEEGRNHVSKVTRELILRRARPDESGLYSCDGKPAVYVTVTKGETTERGVIHLAGMEKESITLHCGSSVQNKVTWSRERNGTKEDIIKCNGDSETKIIKDPQKHFSLLADKSLYILKLNVSYSGRYLCDNEPAVELTVIPTGTKIYNITEGSTFPPEYPVDVTGSDSTTCHGEKAGHNFVSSINKIKNGNVHLDDTGLYFCNGKIAFYLNVTKVDGPDRDNHLFLGLLVGIGGLIILIIIIIIIVCWTWRFRLKRLAFERSSNESNSIYCMATFPGETNQTEPTYYVIADQPQTGSGTDPSQSMVDVYAPVEEE
ncbi:unnamed protein product [Menidia menidia]|uniref:(Atlantic silverside) hypothetical protein n=1 Tax=Menidia menidia TaxID=238744 RepID=A0A8S4AKL5_9TELE|nr:unnamed protein product [Menidia menidia]